MDSKNDYYSGKSTKFVIQYYKHTLFQVGISYVFDRRIYVYLLQIPISGIPVAYMKLKVNENVSLNEVCYYNY